MIVLGQVNLVQNNVVGLSLIPNVSEHPTDAPLELSESLPAIPCRGATRGCSKDRGSRGAQLLHGPWIGRATPPRALCLLNMCFMSQTLHGTAIGLPISWGGGLGGLSGAAVRTGSPRRVVSGIDRVEGPKFRIALKPKEWHKSSHQ